MCSQSSACFRGKDIYVTFVSGNINIFEKIKYYNNGCFKADIFMTKFRDYTKAHCNHKYLIKLSYMHISQVLNLDELI